MNENDCKNWHEKTKHSKNSLKKHHTHTHTQNTTINSKQPHNVVTNVIRVGFHFWVPNFKPFLLKHSSDHCTNPHRTLGAKQRGCLGVGDEWDPDPVLESSQSDEGGRLKNKMSSSRTDTGSHRVLWYNPDWGYQGGLPGEGGV